MHRRAGRCHRSRIMFHDSSGSTACRRPPSRFGRRASSRPRGPVTTACSPRPDRRPRSGRVGGGRQRRQRPQIHIRTTGVATAAPCPRPYQEVRANGWQLACRHAPPPGSVMIGAITLTSAPSSRGSRQRPDCVLAPGSAVDQGAPGSFNARKSHSSRGRAGQRRSSCRTDLI